MEITLTQEDEIHFVEVHGECDASSSIILDSAIEDILQKNPKIVMVDCTHLEYISSSGIGVFTSRIEECEEKGVLFVIFGLNKTVDNVFKLLGLDQLLPIFQTKEDAKQYAYLQN